MNIYFSFLCLSFSFDFVYQRFLISFLYIRKREFFYIELKKKGKNIINETISFTFLIQGKSIVCDMTAMCLTFLSLNLTVHIRNKQFSTFFFIYFIGKMFWKFYSNLPLPKHVSIPSIRLCSSVNSLGPEQTGQWHFLFFFIFTLYSKLIDRKYGNSFLFHKLLECNAVKLLGTIVSKARTLSNGVKSVVVRTVEDTDV